MKARGGEGEGACRDRGLRFMGSEFREHFLLSVGCDHYSKYGRSYFLAHQQCQQCRIHGQLELGFLTIYCGVQT